MWLRLDATNSNDFVNKGIQIPAALPTELQEDYQGRLETPLQILKYYRDLQSNTAGREREDLDRMVTSLFNYLAPIKANQSLLI